MSASYPTEILSDTATLLETICPEEILLVGSAIQQIADSYQEQCNLINKTCNITHIDSQTPLTDPAFTQRFDLAITSEIIELENKQHAELILGRLRDLCAPKIIILAKLKNSLWEENELYGYGFSKYIQQNFIDHNVNIYYYNIDSYKRTPDWFNPKNWANPELWNKFWW